MKLYSQTTKTSFKKPTVFIHGNLASSQWWRPLLEQACGEQSDALVLDLRGCGQSAYWKENATITVDELVDDIVSVLDNTSNFSEDFVLVGHSLGGLLSAKLASLYKDRVIGLYLLDPVGPKGVEFAPEMYDAIEAMSADKTLTGNVIHSTIYNGELSTEFKSQITDDAFRAVQNIGREILKTLKDIDITSELNAITANTLLCWGEKDIIIAKDDVKLYLENIAKSRFEEIENQGHCWNVENPKAMYIHLNQFIDSLE